MRFRRPYIALSLRLAASAGLDLSIPTAARSTGLTEKALSTHHITAVSQLGGDKPHYDRIVLARPFGVIGGSAHAIYHGGCRNIWLVPDHRIENVLREKRLIPPFGGSNPPARRFAIEDPTSGE
jgi:hypothetical protein